MYGTFPKPGCPEFPCFVFLQITDRGQYNSYPIAQCMLKSLITLNTHSVKDKVKKDLPSAGKYPSSLFFYG